MSQISTVEAPPPRLSGLGASMGSCQHGVCQHVQHVQHAQHAQHAQHGVCTAWGQVLNFNPPEVLLSGGVAPWASALAISWLTRATVRPSSAAKAVIVMLPWT